MKRTAFSLVELSIVLVILGLLVGGILAGQSLIRASELRSVVAERDRYITAVHGFRDKYFALPGDMANATSFWGDQATGTASCASAATADGTPGTCNGDGNGLIHGDAYNGPESMRAWQHLSFAGLIEGNYLGYMATGDVRPGIDVAASKLSPGTWMLFARTASPIYGVTGNFLYLGAPSAAFSGYWGTPLKPAEAWNIDSKLDDGRPDSGLMLAGGDAQVCVLPNSVDYGVAPANRTYNLALGTAVCRAWFRLGGA